jgi:hypothetical protein
MKIGGLIFLTATEREQNIDLAGFIYLVDILYSKQVLDSNFVLVDEGKIIL